MSGRATWGLPRPFEAQGELKLGGVSPGEGCGLGRCS
jgi:hypothetical protein